MAKAERSDNPFGWILLGGLIGAIATAGVLLVAGAMSNRSSNEPPAETRTAADNAAVAARPAPPVAPKPEAPAPAAPAPPPAVEQPSVDAQMADDAAAAGMTSRAEPAPPAQPVN